MVKAFYSEGNINGHYILDIMDYDSRPKCVCEVRPYTDIHVDGSQYMCMHPTPSEHTQYMNSERKTLSHSRTISPAICFMAAIHVRIHSSQPDVLPGGYLIESSHSHTHTHTPGEPYRGGSGKERRQAGALDNFLDTRRPNFSRPIHSFYT